MRKRYARGVAPIARASEARPLEQLQRGLGVLRRAIGLAGAIRRGRRFASAVDVAGWNERV
ncbi:MAG TPA: hypothetical protein VNK43_09620 [Gemmatimonadales bacterium]|nr:hypothetical protein [Gemmatimonadales bacterium]